MILLDNIIFELQAIGGISRYWSNTISRIDARDEHIVFLEGSGASENIFRKDLGLQHEILLEMGPLSLRRIKDAKQYTEVFHSSYYRISKNARANVVTIHDFMNEKFPSGLNDRVLARVKKRACLSADTIVVVSEKTRSDLLRYYASVDPSRVRVVYNGVDREYYPEPFHSSFDVSGITLVPRGFFLFVGTRGYCKNFRFVLRFMAEAWSIGISLPLVVVGGGRFSRKELAEVANCGLPESALHHFLYLSDSDLRVLYSNCLSLLIPSIYEGFGLPAAEAARCGALVLSAKGSALDEIVGDTDFAFDLKRDDEPARILKLGLDSAYAEEERDRMRERSKIFDWDASVDRLMEIYDEV